MKLSKGLTLTLSNIGIREDPEVFIAKCIRRGWIKPAPPLPPPEPPQKEEPSQPEVAL